MNIDDIVVVKLITGEELIGRVSKAHDFNQGKELTLEKILGIGYDIQGPGKIGFGFMPYSPLTENKKTFRFDHIIYVSVPADTLDEAYRKATGAVIAPRQSLIVE